MVEVSLEIGFTYNFVNSHFCCLLTGQVSAHAVCIVGGDSFAGGAAATGDQAHVQKSCLG